MKSYKNLGYSLLFCLCILPLAACQKEQTPNTVPGTSLAAPYKEQPSDGASDTNSDTASDMPLRDNTPSVLSPQASGSNVFQEENVTLDISNLSEGYFMVQYTGTSPKVRVQILAPDGTKKQPLLASGNEYQTFPVSEGNGTYQITVLENVAGTSYAVLLSQSVEVALTDEFRPFLYPNQFVDFQSSTAAVSEGSRLAQNAHTDLEVIQNIYHYVVENITYDEEKALQVKDGYLPVLDDTLSTRKGICFDYASLMTCMMRTQNIPTRLEIGYSGDIKHAWISAYVDEIGWIDNIIQFDGSSWTLMDPTLAANNNSKEVGKYIGNGNNYTLQYSY